MRLARIFQTTTLSLLAAFATGGARAAPAPTPVVPQLFENYSQLFARIVADRELGSPYDEALVQRVQADSQIDHVRDNSSEPIAIVQVRVQNSNDDRGTQPEDGNFPFYVVRETPEGLVLLGQMFGRSYKAVTKDRNLYFLVELHRSPNENVQMRYRVSKDVLINLSVPKPEQPISLARRD